MQALVRGYQQRCRYLRLLQARQRAQEAEAARLKRAQEEEVARLKREQEEKAKRIAAAKTLQAYARGRFQRCRFQAWQARRNNAAVRIQSRWRQVLAQRQYRELHTAWKKAMADRKFDPSE
jgi:hypothetical protein